MFAPQPKSPGDAYVVVILKFELAVFLIITEGCPFNSKDLLLAIELFF